jgi:hypothetical protein
MYGSYGSIQLADSYPGGIQKGKLVACIGDRSTHGGVITAHNQDGTLTAKDELVAVEQLPVTHHQCAIPYHGTNIITAITIKTFHNGKLILTEQAICGCGARLAPPNRNVYVE